jgi:hypothetical protein
VCEPATIAMGISAAVSVAATVAAAKAQASAGQQQGAAINANYYADDAALQFRQLQENQQSTQQQSERAKQAIAERGRITAAMENGGAYEQRLLNESNLAESTDSATISANQRNATQQNAIQRDAAYRGASNAVSSIAYPTTLGTGLQIVGGVAQGAGRIFQYNTARNPGG